MNTTAAAPAATDYAGLAGGTDEALSLADRTPVPAVDVPVADRWYAVVMDGHTAAESTYRLVNSYRRDYAMELVDSINNGIARHGRNSQIMWHIEAVTV